MTDATKAELQEALLALQREVAYYKQLLIELREQIKNLKKEE